MRRLPSLTLLTWLGVPACSTGDPASVVKPTGGQTPPAAAAEPVPAPAKIPEAEADAKPKIEEPDVATLPDGTPIVDCIAPPPAGLACIPGGRFVRGRDDGPANARPAQEIWLQTFYMDINEVTHAEYKACKSAKRCRRGGPLYNDFSRPRQPIVGINWFAAVQYCEQAGKHLPTEAQWEKAARGADGALYPWGDEEATCALAVIKDERGRSCGVKKKKEHPDKGRTFEIGSRPPGVYGLYDMAGNSWEWVHDWATEDWTSCGDDCAGIDPKGPCAGGDPCPGHEQRVVRGGSWYWTAKYATGAHRRTHFPQNEISNFHHFGFRCAASVDEAEALAATPSPDAASQNTGAARAPGLRAPKADLP